MERPYNTKDSNPCDAYAIAELESKIREVGHSALDLAYAIRSEDCYLTRKHVISILKDFFITADELESEMPNE